MRLLVNAGWIGLLVTLCYEDLQPKREEIVNSLGMKLVRIEPGKFLMGQGETVPASREEWKQRDGDESPSHLVHISRPYYLGANEVTNAQFEAFDPEHAKLRGLSSVSKGDSEPVTFVSWDQAVAFCRWLSQKEGRPYRLPTEAEWEYACRAGTTTLFCSGEDLTTSDANFGRAKEGNQSLTTVSVGQYKPNRWGLYDMHGNVEEWCLDWYGPYLSGEQTNPVGRADGIARVTRGGSYNAQQAARVSINPTRYLRSSNRSGCLPEDSNRCVGFRIVLGEMPKTKALPPPPLPRNQQDVRPQPAEQSGRAANEPYFVDFPREGRNPTIPKETWGPIFSQWNHYGAVCVCPNGDVLAAWYTCVSEAGRELALAASRLRSGSDRWDEASLFFDVPDVNDHAPVLLSDGKRLYHFCLQALLGWDDASIILRTSDDSGATWSKPRIILDRHDPRHLSQPCSAYVAKDGTIVLAVDGDKHQDERIMTSPDRGMTWKIGKGDLRAAAGQYAIHPAAAPRNDGSIITFLRGPKPMPAFVSKDLGNTWQSLTTPFPGISGGQKAAALRLASGSLLLCSIDTSKELVGGGTFAALSFDDGKTWPHIRKVEGAGGYLSAAQATNGVIYLFGTRMSCAAFNEAWLKQK